MGEMADYYRNIEDEWKHDVGYIKPVEKIILHKSKDGNIVCVTGNSNKYPKMSDSHLLNTIRFIENKAKQGIKIQQGGGYEADDMWYDEEILTGKKALKHLHYKQYIKEAQKRKLI